MRVCRHPVLILMLALAAPAAAAGSTIARKNREGNRLFAEGKFADAERAYVEAQVDAPGRAELLYNHGNALIRQKKYEPALHQLRQAVGKGDRGLQASAWFNSGNTLYEMGAFGDAAQAYIQALRINPADRDAKHNLELALQKAREQQDRSAKGDQSKDNRGADPQQSDKRNGQGQQADARGNVPPQKEEQSKPANPQATQADGREAGFTKDQALQILDALQNQELVEQKKRLERLARRKAAGRDW
jgi:tetratricopeptide (TPR) repeat protein